WSCGFTSSGANTKPRRRDLCRRPHHPAVGVCRKLRLEFHWNWDAPPLESAPYSFAVLRTAVILCFSPGARVTDASRILLASTQRNCVHSPSPKSANRAAPSRQGFHTTVLSELAFFSRM